MSVYLDIMTCHYIRRGGGVTICGVIGYAFLTLPYYEMTTCYHLLIINKECVNFKNEGHI